MKPLCCLEKSETSYQISRRHILMLRSKWYCFYTNRWYKKHVKVQSMTEPLTKLTCKRLSHNQRWRPYLNVISGLKILSGKPDVTSWLTRWRTNVQTGYPTECIRRLHVKNSSERLYVTPELLPSSFRIAATCVPTSRLQDYFMSLRKTYIANH